MIDVTIRKYDYDEEALGFEEPQTPTTARPISNLEYLSLAVVIIGCVLVGLNIAAVLGGKVEPAWLSLLISWGLLTLGSTAYWWARYRGTEPGIKHDGTMFRGIQSRGWVAWILGLLITGFYIVLYWYGDLQARGMAPLLEGPIRTLDPLAFALTGNAADQWFLYGFLYTLSILVMGVRMFWRYRHNRYHLIRTGSVMFFQLGFAFLLPGILKNLNQPEYYFTYFWPLKPNYGWPGQGNTGYILDSGTIGWFMIGFGVFAILILTPVLTYFFGKRWYCSWVCGCGGLAETLGDPWRHLSDKSASAWKIERVLIHSVLVFIVVLTAMMWINAATGRAVFGGATPTLNKIYGFLIINTFSGVIGVGFYPLMGSRVWCRFGCPMAAILGLLQRYFSRFRITTNGSQCMSCGNCSTYCEMGIDVRAYAQRGENIVRASCVGCGVCAAVCPRGVLKLENGQSIKGRYAQAEGGPLSQLIADISNGANPYRAAK